MLGRFGDALPLYQQALAIQQRGLPPDQFDFAPVLIGLGECQLELGRPAEALAPLERAIKIAEPTQKPSDLARPRFALARALWDSGGDRARATDLAKQARAAFAAEGPNEKRRMARIRAWFTAKRI
jgi:tetratricopeptide (TPR) repeat protein